MRTSQITAEEIEAAERAAADRRDSRNRGFAKMHERDQAVKRLSNGVTMIWHVDRELGKQVSTYTNEAGEEVEVTLYPPNIPSDCFALEIEGKTHLFNLEEFRRWLRWG